MDRDEAGRAKIRKYGREWVYDAASAVVNAPTTIRRVLPVTLSWKGLWSKRSATALSVTWECQPEPSDGSPRR